MKRNIDMTKVNDSKQRTISFVMDQVHKEKHSWNIRYILKRSLAPVLILVLAFVLIQNIGENNPFVDNVPVTLNAETSEKIAELSYISTTLFTNQSTVATSNLTQLATTELTEFEEEFDSVNLYFDMLKVFLEDQPFDNTITTTELEDSDYSFLITFTVNEDLYEFYINIVDTIITGELHYNNDILLVSGKYIEDGDDLKIELEASNGDNYTFIEYKKDSTSTIKYDIKERYNGVETEKQFKVVNEEDSSKIDIVDGDNNYTLKKEIEDGQSKYKLEYKVNGVTGNVNITEEVDEQGNTIYAYQIKEGSIEKSISSKSKGNSQDNNGSDDNPGNGTDDNPGNGNSSKQSIKQIIKYQKNSL